MSEELNWLVAWAVFTLVALFVILLSLDTRWAFWVCAAEIGATVAWLFGRRAKKRHRCVFDSDVKALYHRPDTTVVMALRCKCGRWLGL